ncbi:hypothetical protein C0Q70_14000 [Pomacea canaliculata]|uniref:Uncharacterized protein n=1 Tax=Pomacea canaliculata TaxID=400727 RepID=A0A2T7NYT4_POMCA|nr:hypothetical protein C0Q70_14000 [Pomacea canaliculata]
MERERRQVTHAAVREEPHRACELKLHEIKAALVTQQGMHRENYGLSPSPDVPSHQAHGPLQARCFRQSPPNTGGYRLFILRTVSRNKKEKG